MPHKFDWSAGVCESVWEMWQASWLNFETVNGRNGEASEEIELTVFTGRKTNTYSRSLSDSAYLIGIKLFSLNEVGQ